MHYGCLEKLNMLKKSVVTLILLFITNITIAKTLTMKLDSLDIIAQEYVKLSLSIGQHHSSYIDAYYGPKEWEPTGKPIPLQSLLETTRHLIRTIEEIEIPENEKQRAEFLSIQLKGADVFIRMQLGEKVLFDDESKELYDAVSPTLDLASFDKTLAELEALFPGEEPLNQKMKAFDEIFVIPTEKLDTVFVAAITEARERTKQHINLPANESFKIEYVTNKVWSGYNWYKGNNFSVIQLNTDFPIYINRAIDLASHEGYPGHHVFNSQMEQHLVNNNGWIEYSVYPLFSPMSLLAEGSANYGIEVTFPHDERIKFEKEVLFPLAGIDPELVEKYYQVDGIKQKLSYIDNYVAKHYLDGKIDKEQAIELLMKYALTSREKSTQRIGFIEANRSYVINYNLGQDIVKAYVSELAGEDPNKRWQVFAELLAFPKTASMMTK